MRARSIAPVVAFACAALGASACGGDGDRGSAMSDAGAGNDAHSGDATVGADATFDGGAGADASAGAGADADADAGADADVPGAALPALPLRTSSRWIVDANGQRFKLASVNWYGAESKDYVVAGLDRQDLASIAKSIRTMGFNSVRLPWSNEMVETDPPIDAARLAKNPALVGEHALAVLDAVVDALAQQGLVVILDNHRSDADWCCDVAHDDGLWHTSDYPESKWLADWRGIVTRYASQPAVVGVDLRNELRPALSAGAPSTCTDCGVGCACDTPVWGGGDSLLDWHAAAERGGNAVLAVNPALLVIVEGLGYALDLTGVYNLPVALGVPDRLVYSAHDYSFSHAAYATYADMKTDLGDRWGYILTQGTSYTAPIWVGEFGTDHTQATSVDDTSGQGFWFESLRTYLVEADIDWCYWALNGTEATGFSRTLGAEETYGVLSTAWDAPALPALLTALQAIQAKTQGP